MIKKTYNYLKEKVIRFKKWLVILIFGAAVLAAPLLVPPDTSFENLERVEKIGEKYKITYNSDPTEEMEVELGGDEADFMPTAKLKKWGDETFIKVKHKTVKKIKPEQKNGKLKWKDKDKEIHFYTIDDDKFEFEIILKKKPKTNIVELDIESKGLAFYHQPALNIEMAGQDCWTDACTETDCCDSHRPIEIVNSYAVYHESKQGDYSKMGLKNYRAGKAFHIYRPKIIDSAGKEVWGELNITENLLTVEISQEFLDTCQYPIRHAAGLTFGHTGIGTTGYTATGANAMKGSLFTSPADADTAESLTFYGYKNGPPPDLNVKGVLVLHSNLNILTNGVGGAQLITHTSGAWTTSTFGTAPTLSASTEYVLAIVSSLSYYEFAYDTGDANQGHSDTTNNYATPTNPTDASHSTSKFSIYCTYQAGAPEARRMFLIE